ncbi:MAG: ribonuclease P protein component [Acidimicrobiales bacterium]
MGRIRRRATFGALSRPDGRATVGPLSVVYSRRAPEAEGLPVVGYAIGRRFGGAVERNRLRRRLREAVRSSGSELADGAYLVRAAPAAGDLDFEELCRAVHAAARAAAGRETAGRETGTGR